MTSPGTCWHTSIMELRSLAYFLGQTQQAMRVFMTMMQSVMCNNLSVCWELFKIHTHIRLLAKYCSVQRPYLTHSNSLGNLALPRVQAIFHLCAIDFLPLRRSPRSEEHTSELQSL